MMALAGYPPQEKLSAAGQAYHDRVLALGAGVGPGEDIAYGPDPYQRILIHRAPRPGGAMQVVERGVCGAVGGAGHTALRAAPAGASAPMGCSLASTSSLTPDIGSTLSTP